jgi:hypothetical protein
MSQAPTQASPAPKALQNRGELLSRVFFLAFFSFATVAFGNIVIVGVDPAKETVEAFTLYDRAHLICFCCALFYWGLCAWYTARLMLERSFAPFDYILPCVSQRFASRVIRWTPRVLGLAAVVPIALLFLFDPGMKEMFWVRLAPIGVGVLLLSFFVFRRRGAFGEFVVPLPAEAGYGYRRFRIITWKGWTLMLLLFGVSSTVLVALLIDGLAVARWIGTPAILLVALGSWALFGGFVLLYLPMSRGFPAWTPWPFVLAAVFSLWMENHNTPVGTPPKPSASSASWTRPSLEEHWPAWRTALDQTDCKDKPIYLVAMAGGATRAALWSAYVLSALEDDERRVAAAERRRPCFARNIFAISGVSGGSLGAAAFVSLLAQEQLVQRRWLRLRLASADFLGRDVLAPIIGYMLFQDALQRFLPYPFTTLDRSHGLEDAWKADWSDTVASKLPPGPGGTGVPVNWFAQPIRELYADGRNLTLPSLFLNTTRVADGKKVVQSNLTFTPEDAYDMYAPGLLTADLTLAGAVHNSARFTYVSPAGLVWQLSHNGKRAMPWGYVVDGGYFENSGAGTLAPLIRRITKIDSANARRLVLVILSNDPSDGSTDYVCSDDASALEPKPKGERETWPRFLQQRDPKPRRFGIEVAAPLVALYQTRTSRAHAASVVARNAIDRECDSGRIVELRIPMARSETDDPPMSWFLNDLSQQRLKQLVTANAYGDDTPARRLCENVETLKWWIQGGSADTRPKLLLARCRQKEN